jgi:hypothetical protein
METAKFCGLSWTIPSVFFGNESRGPYQRLELARVVHSGTVGERIAILERLVGETKSKKCYLPSFTTKYLYTQLNKA